jgi:hypothetical protein
MAQVAHPSHHCARTSEGQSVFEIMVATAILVCCLLPIFGFSQRNMVEAESVQEQLLAQQLVMDLCERYKCSTPTELMQVAADGRAIEQDYLLQPLGRSTRTSEAGSRSKRTGPSFRRSVHFEENAGSITGLHKVTFTVSWSPARSRSNSYSLTRIIHFHKPY